ncbi:hypothetical protein Pelo_17618 [Pelomyxa schiedti]|nr:hypothetical protein Pelo_17618 [Pelomyxa schiedti]
MTSKRVTVVATTTTTPNGANASKHCQRGVLLGRDWVVCRITTSRVALSSDLSHENCRDVLTTTVIKKPAGQHERIHHPDETRPIMTV